MKPSEQYLTWINQQKFVFNSEQERVIMKLDEQYSYLISTHNQQKINRKNILNQGLAKIASWYRNISGESHEHSGYYLFGPVGTGKTFVIDMLLTCLPENLVQQMHFTTLMDMLHQQLHSNAKNSKLLAKTLDKGKKLTPKKIILQNQKKIETALKQLLRPEVTILFIDEMYVEDIGDASLLSGIIKALKSLGVFMLTTSNIVPDDLYKNGFQRESFLPTIAWIKQHYHIETLDHGIDYRENKSSIKQYFFCEAEPKVVLDVVSMQTQQHINCQIEQDTVTIMNRSIEIYGQGAVNAGKKTKRWLALSFHNLCATSRSYRDYVAIAKDYDLIILLNIPSINDEQLDQARRWVSAIDAIYHEKLGLIFQSHVPIHQIYQGTLLAGIYERCTSRMGEMKTKKWLQESKWMV